MSVLSNTPSQHVLELHSGDKMTQEEFHRIYAQMPKGFRADLVGGIVYVTSPLTRRHAANHPPLTTLLFTYAASTTGTECGDNATVLLGEESEPQPDLYLRVLPEFGGQSHTSDDDYVVGAPELVAEIALSSRSIDLHAKRQDYALHGVQEYLVLDLTENRLHWFDLTSGHELMPEKDGIHRLRTFPGLWIDSQALLAKDAQKMVDVLQQGLSAPEHAQFMQRLASANKQGG
jgi:Uma2 family endonuclease